jgi:hypothetical protein
LVIIYNSFTIEIGKGSALVKVEERGRKGGREGGREGFYGGDCPST